MTSFPRRRSVTGAMRPGSTFVLYPSGSKTSAGTIARREDGHHDSLTQVPLNMQSLVPASNKISLYIVFCSFTLPLLEITLVRGSQPTISARN